MIYLIVVLLLAFLLFHYAVSRNLEEQDLRQLLVVEEKTTLRDDPTILVMLDCLWSQWSQLWSVMMMTMVSSHLQPFLGRWGCDSKATRED